jgi:hypothetical protein
MWLDPRFATITDLRLQRRLDADVLHPKKLGPVRIFVRQAMQALAQR